MNTPTNSSTADRSPTGDSNASSSATAAENMPPENMLTEKTHTEPDDAPLQHVAPLKEKRRIGLFLAWAWITLLVFTSITASWLPIKPYEESFVTGIQQSPRFSFTEPLGGDQLGRSILSRIIYGGRVTLAIGVIAVLIGFLLGGVLGLLAGYSGKWVDYVLTTLTDAMLAFPPIVFLLALTAVLKGAGEQLTLQKMVVMLAVLTVPNFFRQTRAQVIAIRDREFVRSAESLGAPRSWILFRELAPNVILPVMSIMFVVMAGLIIAEGSLSLLGVGIPEPQPSWGRMIRDGKENLQSSQEHLHGLIIPMVVLFLSVFSFNVVGEAARTKLDPRASRF